MAHLAASKRGRFSPYPPGFAAVLQKQAGLSKAFDLLDPLGSATVTVDDFYYRGLATAVPTINPFKIGLSSAFYIRFPDVNRLGISATRVDFAPGGVVPLHSHQRGTELLFVIEGDMAAGFISSVTNRVYTKTLHKGDLMVSPQGLLHFQYNVG